MANWQTAPTILVAPYYGATGGSKRGGFNPEFLDRVRRGEYPQCMWDSLPLGGSTAESILRLDHIQPIGRHYNSYELTDYRLSDTAVEILDEWVGWVLTGTLDPQGALYMIREELANLDIKAK